MIIVYPMLISENVNPDVIPGLAKSIENYILVYNTDKLIKQVNNSAKHIVATGAKGLFQAGIGVGTALGIQKLAKNAATKLNPPLPGFRIMKKKGKALVVTEVASNKPSYSNKPQSPAQALQKGVEKATEMKFKGGVERIEMPKLSQVSIEPTWVQVQTDSGTKLLGVKVVPYTIKTDSMVALLLNDSSLKLMPAIMKKYGRIVIRILLRVWKNIKKTLPGIKGSPITGDAKNDIVYANTEYRKDLFICLSKLDVEQTPLDQRPAVMSKLNQLGWASMMFADDVNKQMSYCMKEFGGVCSMIPYTHIYASFGKEHSKVYTDLLDAQKATGPFFRKKSTTRRKIFTK